MGDEEPLEREPSALETVTGVARMFGVDRVDFEFSPEVPAAGFEAQTRIEVEIDGEELVAKGPDDVYAARMAVLMIVGRVLGVALDDESGL